MDSSLAQLHFFNYKIIHFADVYQLTGKGCIESATARNVPLNRELKHLLLKADDRFIMTHLSANKMLSFSKVKNILKLKVLEMAKLSEFGIKKGEVSPFQTRFWYLTHVIDRDIFSMSWMTTNDGTRTGYIRFEPSILLCAEHVIINNIGKEA